MLLRVLVLILGSGSCLSLLAQQGHLLDSLLLGYEQAPTDSAKYPYVDELFWQHIYSDKEQAREYAYDAIHNSRRLSSIERLFDHS